MPRPFGAVRSSQTQAKALPSDEEPDGVAILGRRRQGEADPTDIGLGGHRRDGTDRRAGQATGLP